MHFIIFSKKESFREEQINHDLLISSRAPSLISKNVVKLEISKFIIYIYPYKHIEDELRGYSYYADENQFLLCNGIVNLNNQLRKDDLLEFFHDIDTSSDPDLLGDYQLIKIDKKGDGYIKTPPVSIRQLFHYEDENLEVLSTEIKLIVDGVNKFRSKKFIDHYDYDFIEDSIYREWHDRNYPQNTVFKEIKRIFPHDHKYFKDNKLVIERKNSINIPEWFKNAYKEDREGLYDQYLQILLEFTDTNLSKFKRDIRRIILGLTGGYDSRLNASVLFQICRKHKIPLIGYTSGKKEHPDVVIAKKLSEIIDIPHFHHQPPNNCFKNAQTNEDYIDTFYTAQGDWNSNDFVPFHERELAKTISPLTGNVSPAIGVYPVNESELYMLGTDAYKRTLLWKIVEANRWKARRTLFQGCFFLPLFLTKYDVWFSLMYGAEKSKEYYKEFIYEILKRAKPELLDLPSVGDKLPRTEVEPYQERIDSKYHEKEPFLWDYDLVINKIRPVFKKKFDELNQEEKSILKKTGLNELDYFLNRDISKIIGLYRKKEITLDHFYRLLLRERFSGKIPKIKTMIKLNKEQRKSFTVPRLMILMDFAVVADMHSFEEIEDRLGI